MTTTALMSALLLGLLLVAAAPATADPIEIHDEDHPDDGPACVVVYPGRIPPVNVYVNECL